MNSRKKKKISKKWLLIPALLAAAAVLGLLYRDKMKGKTEAAGQATVRTTSVTRGTISNELTSSGTLSPKNTYTITSLVDGEVLEAPFSEGDEVKAGDVLYVIDSKEVDSQIASAEKALENAQEEYDAALSEYELMNEKYADGRVCSTQSGYLRNLNLQSGDTVSGSSQIADLYDNGGMKIRLPFLSQEADVLWVGQDISVVLGDTGEHIPGKIIEKSSLRETLGGGTIVRYVTVYVTNPGGLSESDTATAFTDGITSAGDGTFEPAAEGKLRLDLPSQVKVGKVSVSEGSYVSAGTVLFTMEEESVTELLKSYRKTLTQAETALQNAEEKLDTLKDNKENYVITAPIDGRVIYKVAKAGDKVAKTGSSQSSLALIYDLSALTFEMSIDELDISRVVKGQEVVITADAFSGSVYEGTVTNVSLNSSYQSGVTTYPVTVTLSEKGDLLPGMNVNGTVILEKAEDALVIPSDSLIRGDLVYVKTDSITEEDTPDIAENTNVPEGFTAVRVTTGIISDDLVEITSGLSETMQVYTGTKTTGEKAAEAGNMFDMMNGGNAGAPGGGRTGSGAGGFPGGGERSGGSAGNARNGAAGRGNANAGGGFR